MNDIIKNYWENLTYFINIDDIPDVPRCTKEEMETFYIPILIKCGAIAKKDLIINKTYEGSCRNSSEAIWDGEKFIYERFKFGQKYLEEINHFEDDDGYDIFIPLKEKDLK